VEPLGASEPTSEGENGVEVPLGELGTSGARGACRVVKTRKMVVNAPRSGSSSGYHKHKIEMNRRNRPSDVASLRME
jgi:hypothetical protein